MVVNAAGEGRALVALEKATGTEVWKAAADGLELCYGTPLLVELDTDTPDLVIAAPGEVWGIDPDTGKLRWFAYAPLPGNVCPSVIAHDGIVYAMGGFPRRGTIAIRAGGKGNVTQTHVLWTSTVASYVPSPVYHEGHLYFIGHRGVATCLDARTGRPVYQERLPLRGRGNPVYASPVLVEGRLFVPTRFGGTAVLAAKPTFELLGINKLETDASLVNGSLAIAGGCFFLRSNRYLYCLAE